MAQTRRSKVKGPQQVTVLSRDLAVLRRIDPAKLSRNKKERDNLISKLGMLEIDPGLPEGEMAWFADGYVANDMPRTSIYTDRIVAATVDFALARTDTGEIMREGLTLAQCEQAMDKAQRREPIIEFDLDDEDEDEDEPVEESPEPEIEEELEDQVPNPDEDPE